MAEVVDDVFGQPAAALVNGDFANPVLVVDEIDKTASDAVEPLAEQAWLAPGDALVLYSDGFTEVRRGADMLGESGLVAALSGLTPGSGGAVIVERLRASAASYGPQRDDMALLVLTIPTD